MNKPIVHLRHLNTQKTVCGETMSAAWEGTWTHDKKDVTCPECRKLMASHPNAAYVVTLENGGEIDGVVCAGATKESALALARELMSESSWKYSWATLVLFADGDYKALQENQL